MNAAQRSVELDETVRNPLPGAEEPSVLREQMAERLRAHRARRGRVAEVQVEGDAGDEVAESAPRAGRSRAAEVRAAVAQRYAESPSYRAVLAAESARSVREAEAAAEIANINARAIARAQQHLLSELGDWGAEAAAQQPASAMPLAGPLPMPEPARAAAAILLAQQQQRLEQGVARPPIAAAARLDEEVYGREMAPARLEPVVVTEVQRAGLTVRLIEEVTRPAYHAGQRPDAATSDRDMGQHEAMAHEAMLLDEEILFRNDPTFDETRGPEPIAANLIEFPRQLVAARKARPRLAEGPLREETTAGQLRIFEVEAEHISAAPAPETQMPEWSSILLSAQPAMTFFAPAVDGEPAYAPGMVPQTAPLRRRVMAGTLDAALILIGTLGAIAVFVLTVTYLTHEPLEIPRLVAAGTSVGTLLVLTAVYHVLFFTFSEATPGMRYAHIALCTLTDENPTRAAMRKRLLAMTLAAMPLGMGFAWALLDEDRMGWHDRMSRMYQRAY